MNFEKNKPIPAMRKGYKIQRTRLFQGANYILVVNYHGLNLYAEYAANEYSELFKKSYKRENIIGVWKITWKK